MKTDIKTVDTILSAMGVHLPVEPLSRLDMEEYLSQLNHILALAAGERQRLGGLLRAAQRITAEQLDDALAQQRCDHRKLGEILIEKRLLTPQERDTILEFQRRQSGIAPPSGKFTLGNILLANGDITRVQLKDALHRQTHSGRRLGAELITAGHASKKQIDDGLLLQRKIIAYALAVSVGLAPLAPTDAAAKPVAAMGVSATVIANAKLKTEHQETQLRITEADLARGYVEVAVASRFAVQTNSRSGYVMEFLPVGNLFTWVQVGGLANAARLGSEGGTIVQRGPLSPGLIHELSFRFVLQADAQTGTYPWPLHMSVRAL